MVKSGVAVKAGLGAARSAHGDGMGGARLSTKEPMFHKRASVSEDELRLPHGLGTGSGLAAEGCGTARSSRDWSKSAEVSEGPRVVEGREGKAASVVKSGCDGYRLQCIVARRVRRLQTGQ